MRRTQEKEKRLNENYSYLHCFELVKNIREVLFLTERFLSTYDPENNEYAAILPSGMVYDRELASEVSREITPATWSINTDMLDEYVSGLREIQCVVGEKTRYCAFHATSYEQPIARLAAKHLYRLLRDEFNIPSEAIIVFEDGWSGYYILVFFHKQVYTTSLERFQSCVENIVSEAALNLGASVISLTRQRAYIPLPLGVNPETKLRRSIVSATSFKPISDIRSYASGHVALSGSQVNSLLRRNFDKIEKSLIKPAEWLDGKVPDLSVYPASVAITVAEAECIRRQPKKSIRLLLLIIMMCLKSAPKDRATDSVTISSDNLCRLSGLSLGTVKSAITEMCSNDILIKSNTANSVTIGGSNKGPKATNYSLGNAVVNSIEQMDASSSDACRIIPTHSVLEAFYLWDEGFFPALYCNLMATWKRKWKTKRVEPER